MQKYIKEIDWSQKTKSLTKGIKWSLNSYMGKFSLAIFYFFTTIVLILPIGVIYSLFGGDFKKIYSKFLRNIDKFTLWLSQE